MADDVTPPHGGWFEEVPRPLLAQQMISALLNKCQTPIQLPLWQSYPTIAVSPNSIEK